MQRIVPNGKSPPQLDRTFTTKIGDLIKFSVFNVHGFISLRDYIIILIVIGRPFASHRCWISVIVCLCNENALAHNMKISFRILCERTSKRPEICGPPNHGININSLSRYFIQFLEMVNLSRRRTKIVRRSRHTLRRLFWFRFRNLL